MTVSQQTFRCGVCGQEFPPSQVMPARFVRPGLVTLIRQEHPDWNEESHICHPDMNHYRGLYVQQVLQDEKGELTHLEHQVLTSMKEHEILAQNLNSLLAERATFGEQVADRVAAFGGSWTFILIFTGILLVWVVVNSIGLLFKPFDPYPFILLNLVLSCLAALQAPVIMMSQNRQQAKDRAQAENDYRVNLKAELEIRHLHSKLDLLLTHQWQRLLEIQQIQTELLEELGRKPAGEG